MTIKAVPAPGTTERFVFSTFRVLNDVFAAVGDGIRARNEFSARVGRGGDPVEAAAGAIRSASPH